jgi:hypothetical protein
MTSKPEETLWTRLSRSWLMPRLEPCLAEDAGLPAARSRLTLGPMVSAYLR